ncbi:L,D-transpeptidase [Winogradskyella sp.]|nr:L,D-transpeptidase [Winogradskyella sp.]
MKHILAFVFYFLFFGCINTNNENRDEGNLNIENETVQMENLKQSNTILPIEIVVKKDVSIRSYFKWMDSVVATQNEKLNYITDEYLIVHNNKWIIDTLAHTDYYYLMGKGIFNEDSKALIALKKGQILVLPDSVKTQELKERLQHTHLDLNIPEFRLRIMQDEKEIYSFPVRVGQNGRRYLAMAKGDVDMRTKSGIGKIIRVNKNPTFINPKNNHKYKLTKRDDGKVTQLPVIPWLEPALGGVSHGQLIHPTTNLITLEKASSNGCIGLSESDAWYIYYYAPLGTKVVFRYDLEATNDEGETIQFKDIYSKYDNTKLKNNTTEKSLNKTDRILDTSCNHIKMN